MAATNIEIQKLDKILTNLIKNDLKKKGLVDTGKLLKSINVKTAFNNNKITLNIEAEDYFDYVDEDKKIMEDVLKSPQWDKAIQDALFEILNNTLEDKLNI